MSKYKQGDKILVEAEVYKTDGDLVSFYFPDFSNPVYHVTEEKKIMGIFKPSDECESDDLTKQMRDTVSKKMSDAYVETRAQRIRNDMSEPTWRGRSQHDPINPSYYTKGIETFDYIQSHEMSYPQGQVIKYVTRYKEKNGLEDLKKAKWYLDKLIGEETKKVLYAALKAR